MRIVSWQIKKTILPQAFHLCGPRFGPRLEGIGFCFMSFLFNGFEKLNCLQCLLYKQIGVMFPL